jgi:hypothetical protein
MKKILLFLPFFLTLAFWSGCGDESASNDTTKGTTADPKSDPGIEPRSAKGGEMTFSLKSGAGYEYYQDKNFSDFWGEPKPTPDIDYAMDLSGMDASELRILRSTIEARKGETFSDDQLRQHFMSTDWYQPPFWNHDFRPQYDADEKAFMEKVQALEKALVDNAYKDAGKVVETNAIGNRFRYSEEFLAKVDPVIHAHGVAIVPTQNEQMFHIYDKNNYEAIPSFITSDFYLQMMSLYFSRILQELETDVFSPIVVGMLEKLIQENETDIATIADAKWKAAAEYNIMFFSLAYELLTGKKKTIPQAWQAAYDDEIAKVRGASGQGSKLLRSEFFDFSLFKPRGHYTRTEELKNYFKAMTWLQTAPFNISNPVSIDASMVTATHFFENKALLGVYNRLSSPVAYLVGEPNKNSVVHLFSVMQGYGIPADPAALFSDEYKEQVIQGVQALGIAGFKAKGANALTDDELQKFAVYFMPQRYTLDAEILIRLVDVERDDLNQQPKRPFPKGLDVMAVLGSKEAEKILLEQYKEAEKWPPYPDTLNVLKQKFAAFDGWDENAYNKWLDMLRTLLNPASQLPREFRNEGWKLKSLNTALGSWTELKHNTLLYADQPVAAQMGDGGEDWPPAWVAGYVEPNWHFWNRAVSLIRAISGKLKELDLSTPNIEGKSKMLIEMGDRLRDIARKQEKGEALSGSDNDFIRFIGGEAEWLTLALLDKRDIRWFELNSVDKFMALAADVYTYQGQGPVPPGVLEEAIGYADEMYVSVKMPDGSIQLMRGAVFSYYEFIQPIDERLTDEEWQKMLRDGKAPERPEWMKEILVSNSQ